MKNYINGGKSWLLQGYGPYTKKPKCNKGSSFNRQSSWQSLKWGTWTKIQVRNSAMALIPKVQWGTWTKIQVRNSAMALIPKVQNVIRCVLFL